MPIFLDKTERIKLLALLDVAEIDSQLCIDWEELRSGVNDDSLTPAQIATLQDAFKSLTAPLKHEANSLLSASDEFRNYIGEKYPDNPAVASLFSKAPKSYWRDEVFRQTLDLFIAEHVKTHGVQNPLVRHFIEKIFFGINHSDTWLRITKDFRVVQTGQKRFAAIEKLKPMHPITKPDAIEEFYTNIEAIKKRYGLNEDTFFKEFFYNPHSLKIEPTAVLELSTGELYIKDGHHHVIALMLSRIIPAKWFKKIPIEPYQYMGNLPNEIVNQLIVLIASHYLKGKKTLAELLPATKAHSKTHSNVITRARSGAVTGMIFGLFAEPIEYGLGQVVPQKYLPVATPPVTIGAFFGLHTWQSMAASGMGFMESTASFAEGFILALPIYLAAEDTISHIFDAVGANTENFLGRISKDATVGATVGGVLSLTAVPAPLHMKILAAGLAMVVVELHLHPEWVVEPHTEALNYYETKKKEALKNNDRTAFTLDSLGEINATYGMKL